jgi:hypothetical protein
MKLWLISQSVNAGYDTYDSAVVAADTEGDARQIHPSGKKWPKPKYDGDRGEWAQTPDQVEAQLIGEANSGTLAGLILASFNAG